MFEWPTPNHLGRWRLLGSFGSVGEATATFWQTAPGNRPAHGQRIQSAAQALDRGENLRLALQVATLVS